MALGLASAFTGQPASPGTNPPPQGLLDLILGQSNPIAQFVDSRRNVVGTLGAGIASSPNFGQGLANAAQNLPQARQADYAQNLYRGQVSQTVAYLQKTHPDLAQAVQSGVLSPADAFQQAFALDNPTGVSLAPGSSLVNPRNGNPMGGATNGITNFVGTDPKAQAAQILQTADPSSPQYAIAWNFLQNQNTTMVPDGKGGMVPVTTSQPPPQGFPQPSYNPLTRTGSLSAPPTGASAPMTDQAPALRQQLAGGAAAPIPGASSVGQNPAGGGVAVGAPIPGITSARVAPNESTNRIDMLSKMINSDVPTAVANFSALQSQKDQILQKDPTGLTNFMKDPKYQQAYASLNGVISNILYTVSGAAIGDKEMERKVISMSPQLGDSTGVAVDKLRRFGDYVNAAAYGSNDPATVQAAQQATSQVEAVAAQMTMNDPIPVTTPQQAAALPHGAYFKTPDGRVKINP